MTGTKPSDVDGLIERLERIVLMADYPGGYVNGSDALALDDVAEAATTLAALQARERRLEQALADALSIIDEAYRKYGVEFDAPDARLAIDARVALKEPS